MHFEQLKQRLSGQVILPGEAEYDELRQVTAGHIDRKPAVIALVADTKDVIEVVKYAVSSGLPLAVRSGGHSNAGHSVVDDGIVLDLRHLHQVEIDSASKTVWVEPGATAAEVTDALASYGFVLGFGDTGSVGIGGITTSGGIGYLVRKFGLAIDNLIAAEIVTADGQLLQIDKTTHSDLFWAIRGGGGNFGVVTRFKFKVQPLTQAYGGMLILPATAEVIAGCLRLAMQAPDELSAIFNIMPAPPMPFLKPELHGKLIVMGLIMYAGDPATGENVLAPFRALAAPLADMVRPMQYKEIFFPADKSYRPLAVSKNMFMKSVDVALAQTILDQLQKSDAAMRVTQLRVLGGAAARIDKDATAFAHRSSPIMTNVASFYTGPADYERRKSWVTETAKLLDQGEPGAYIGFLAEDGEAEVQAAYPEKTRQRLAIIKKQYDPTNVFHLNINIKPA